MLRRQLKVTETLMCDNKWHLIDYPSVPSRAMNHYKNAFEVHDNSRFTEYVNDVANGKSKINSSTLYPVDIIKQLRSMSSSTDMSLLDSQWKALPNYLEGCDVNTMVIVDTSGSMMSGSPVAPIDVAISLGMYLSERLTGPFKDTFMTFSANPEIQHIIGETLMDRMNSVKDANWGFNTDLYSAFMTILEYGITNGCTIDELPSRVIVISDMQFDMCANVPNYEAIINEFAKSEYTNYKPEVIFWNVSQHVSSESPASDFQNGVSIVSGYSPTIMKHIIANHKMNPYTMMLEVLDSERYSRIHV